jgi:septum formation protein
MKIILGSQSKSRKEVLTEMGYEFEVMPSHIDEKAIRIADPVELTMALSVAKADALIPKISEPAILITADQVVVCQGEVWEKPESADEARYFLKTCNVMPVETVGAVVVTNLSNKKRAQAHLRTKLYFNPFSDEEIEKLIEDGEVFRLAGGFGVAGGIWDKHIKNVEGELDSARGLSKIEIARLIKEVLQ